MKKEILKQRLTSDVFSDKASAESRSRDMGFGGATHVYEIEGQAYYMPGETHQDYLWYYDDQPKEVVEEVLTSIYESYVITETRMETHISEGKILKFDEEQRLVYGWASVITEKGEPVVDRQGDIIEPETLEKAVNEFMEHVRVGKTMHVGEQTGQVIHSLPITSDICKSLGIQTDREGWVVAYKVYDDDVWDMVKSGELSAFSIGGRAVSEKV